MTHSYPHRGLCALLYKSIPVRGESDNLFVKIMYVAADGLLYSQEIDVRYYVDLIGGDADG